MKKRVISLILALVLVIGLLPTVLADNNGPNQSQQQLQSVQDFTYEGQTYTLAMGHLEGSGAVHIFN